MFIMKDKIKTARGILCEVSKVDLQNSQREIVWELKETTDKAELIYNDVKIKRGKSKSAFHMMKEIEHKLDMLLQEAKNIKYS